MYNIMHIGILGGGQLGRMLLQEAANYPIKTWVMENDPNCPAAHLCHHFVKGDIKNYDDVVAFGRQVEVLTIEIEAVNVEALEYLETLGKTIIPKPSVLRTIKNKILQKEFYRKNNIHSPAFVVTHNRQDLENHKEMLPAVHKIGEGGYDGKGVQLLHGQDDFHKGFDAPSVLEKMIDIYREIAITVAIASDGNIAIYPPVEMVFDPYLNLLDFQLCPANVEEKVKWKAEAIAVQVAKAFNSPGLFAVELLVDNDNNVWVNETAPRVHNSGHHTIEAHITSQYDMLLRILMGMPLGSTEMLMSSALVNLIGANGFSGEPYFKGMDALMKMEQVYVHLYGKEITKPGRKMGHVTILGKDRVELNMKSKMVKETISVETKD
jgi:5-(carboxyamino)imidazole ribonucleotide synthase